MPGVAPLAVSTMLYNELVGLNPEEVDRAAQIEWTLRGELFRDRRDLKARVGLVQALIHQGKAAEALDEADTAWTLRDRLDPQALETFAAQLLELGDYERSLEITAHIPTSRPNATELAIVAAFNTGNLETFARLARPAALVIVERMRAAGLDAMFPRHQAVVRDALKGRQVATELIWAPGTEGDATAPTLCQMFYLAGTYAERTAVGDDLYDTLAPFYESSNADVAEAWELYTPMLMDFRSRTFTRPG